MLVAAGAVCLAAAPAALAEPQAVEPYTLGDVERLDPAIDDLIPEGAEIEVLADGFQWCEGPVWDKRNGVLLFSEIPGNTAYRWEEGAGLSVYLRPSGHTRGGAQSDEPGSNGLAIDPSGRLLLCQHGDRQLAAMAAPLDEPQATYKTLAAEYDGKRFNSPNDLVVHSSGAIFFTDPPYGLAGKADDPARELPFCGVYRLDPDGKVTLLVRDMTRPNGIALSPDEKTLYVAQSDPDAPLINAFDLTGELGVANERVFFDAGELLKERRGLPDGMAVDNDGVLFATGPGGVLVLSPEGEHLGTIRTGELISNCTFGDDGQTLYMTSDRYLCRVRTATKGLGF
ncbi:SMP-30/gluconolactonase/LRE family protein [Botrimarina sp.]|uniref:SMP-30/gluconolactonase/LRE family protein n=1 Tax=Botrimarina sp. TaxID=2795802 RepID=UPI0032EC177E